MASIRGLRSFRSRHVQRVLADAVAMDCDGMPLERRFHDRVRRLRAQVEHADRDARQVACGGTHGCLEFVELFFTRPPFTPDGGVAEEADERGALRQDLLEMA